MNASADYADDFDTPGRFFASVAAIELVAGGILMATLPRWGLVGSLAWLAVLLGSIVALCVVAMPRRTRTVLIAGLTVLFVLTGARLDLLGTTGHAVAAQETGADAVAAIVAQTPAPEPDETHGRSEVSVAPADAQDGWTGDIDAVLAGLPPAPGVRAIVRSITVDRTAEPNRVALDWSIATGDARKSCGSITIAAADRQVALDQIATTLRFAVDRSRVTGTPQCY